MVQATCVDGEVTVPTVTAARLTRLTYTLDPPGDPAGSYAPGTEATHGDGDGDVGRRFELGHDAARVDVMSTRRRRRYTVELRAGVV